MPPVAVLVLALTTAALAAEPRREVMWHNPGPVEKLDFRWGPGGRAKAPVPPFRFLKEDTSGTAPKIEILDGRGRRYSVKFGEEVPGECFGARMMWATGYFIEPTYCILNKRIMGARDLSSRARKVLAKDGSFRIARFQHRDPAFKFLKDYNWAWTYNPFQGTREVGGLKILIMLLSNWDNKDARDQDEGINTAIFERPGSGPRYVYTFTDWGRTMGGWGGIAPPRPWTCGVFSAQSDAFVSIVNGEIRWGYRGRHRDFTSDITQADVRWAMRFLGRITDRQLRTGLLASGATPEEASCFTRQLRRRINMLRSVASMRLPPAPPRQ